MSASTLSSPPTPLERENVPAKGDRCVVISLHDVSPLTFEESKQIISRLETLGAKHFSLLVIPNHHYRGHIHDFPEFCHWLKDRQARGDEIVIHGYYHQREPKGDENWRARFTTQVYTAGEGEFFDMAGAPAIRLVSTARDEFRKIGLDPRGFIAPAWLLSQPAEAAIKKLGFVYTTHLTDVVDLACGPLYRSQSLVWSVRSFWRRIASRLWNGNLNWRLKKKPLLRIGIHPVDFQHPFVWNQIEELSRRALKDRTSVTYLEWVEKARNSHGF